MSLDGVVRACVSELLASGVRFDGTDIVDCVRKRDSRLVRSEARSPPTRPAAATGPRSTEPRRCWPTTSAERRPAARPSCTCWAITPSSKPPCAASLRPNPSICVTRRSGAGRTSATAAAGLARPPTPTCGAGGKIVLMDETIDDQRWIKASGRWAADSVRMTQAEFDRAVASPGLGLVVLKGSDPLTPAITDADSRTVWVVESGVCEDRFIAGVFDSAEAAKDAFPVRPLRDNEYLTDPDSRARPGGWQWDGHRYLNGLDWDEAASISPVRVGRRSSHLDRRLFRVPSWVGPARR